MKDIESRVKDLENEIFMLKKLLSQNQGYSEGVQSDLWDSQKKQKDKNRELSNNTNTVSNNLFNYEYENDAAVKANTEAIETTADTLDTVMDTVIPSQAESIDEVAETLDTLMTDIIPILMGNE